MQKNFSWESEPGISVCGNRFKLVHSYWIDESGARQRSTTAWGADGDSCAWFWVSPQERARLAALGAEFQDGD